MRAFEPGQAATWTKTITEADVEAFAGITGDYNPLHIDKDAPARSRRNLPEPDAEVRPAGAVRGYHHGPGRGADVASGEAAPHPAHDLHQPAG